MIFMAAAPAFPPYPDSLRTLNDAMRLAASRDSFEIHPAEIRSASGGSESVYYVTMRGTNRSFDKNDVLGINTCLMAFLAKPNIYYDAVKKAMLEKIPAGSTVVMTGHSLGGMITQQIAADREIKEKFRFHSVVNIGSPFVPVEGRSCPLRRFADRADMIPWLGFSVKANLVTEKPVFKSNGYFGKVVAAHTDSYRESATWKHYDPLGILGGGHIIVLGPCL